MRGTAGYDAAEGAGAEVGGGVEFDAAFALCAAAGHLGGCFFGCHCCFAFWLLGFGVWFGAGEGEGWPRKGLLGEGEVQWLGHRVEWLEGLSVGEPLSSGAVNLRTARNRLQRL